MGRPHLPLGTAGSVRVYAVPTGYRARTKVRDMDGVTRELERTARTRAAAERALKEAVRDRSRASAGLISRDSTVADLSMAWYSSLEGRSPSTMEAYRYRLDHQVLPAFGAVRLSELSVGLLDRHLRAVAKRHGPASAKMTRSVLSGLLGYATRMDALERNPIKDLGPTNRGPKTSPRALSPDHLQDLLARVGSDPIAQRQDIPDLVLLLAGSGLRIGEAIALTWQHVDLARNSITVAQTVGRIRGAGLTARTTKSSAGLRVLQVPSWCLAMLSRRRSAAPTATATPTATQPVFAAPLGGWRDPSNTQSDLRRAFDNAGYPWVTSHTFRKTVATLMDQAGLSSRATADQLGHANPSLTQDVYYGRHIPDTGAATILERLLAGS